VTLGSALIGLVLGSIAGFYGRALDEVIMRITDIFMTMPFLIAAMVLVTVLGTGLDNVMIALVAFGWMTYARLIRADIKKTKEFDYVQAAKATGAGDARIILRHVLPNTIFPVFVMATMDIGSMVLTAAALSFLGLGAELGYADWGQMISFARNWMSGVHGNPAEYWYTLVFPGIAILLFVLGWNLMGDGLRDILDPRLRGSR
jgi:peptide/nickel transport system permease protein